MSSHKEFTNSFNKGLEVERVLFDVLIEKEDVLVKPMFQLGMLPNSPKYFSKTSQYSIPDFEVKRGGRTYHVDSKQKKKWVDWNGIIQTGYDYHHYQEYKELAYQGGNRFYIFFVHTTNKTTTHRTFQKGVYVVDITRTPPDRVDDVNDDILAFWFVDHLRKYKYSDEIIKRLQCMEDLK